MGSLHHGIFNSNSTIGLIARAYNIYLKFSQSTFNNITLLHSNSRPERRLLPLLRLFCALMPYIVPFYVTDLGT